LVFAAVVEAGLDAIAFTIEMAGDTLPFGAQSICLAVFAKGFGLIRAPVEMSFDAVRLAVEPRIDVISPPVEAYRLPLPQGVVVAVEAVFGQGWGGNGHGDEQGGTGRFPIHDDSSSLGAGWCQLMARAIFLLP